MTDSKAQTRIFKPTSFTRRVFYPFDKRTALILDEQGIVYRSWARFFDKKISYAEISDVFAEDGILQILKKGVAPYSDEGVIIGLEYGPFMECRWLGRRG